MGRDTNRFASDGVFHALPPLPRAVASGRLINPRGLGLAPARLVTVIDQAIHEALEETPLVLWESEEIVRFELPEARVILALHEADQPGAAGLSLAVVFEGENAPEIAQALNRLILCTIETRYQAFLPEDPPQPLDEELLAQALAPLSGSLPVLAPVATLEEAMWRRAEACQPRPTVADAAPQSLWRRLLSARPRALWIPPLAPLRPSVRALALMLFAFGLTQGPMGQAAKAEPMMKAAKTAP